MSKYKVLLPIAYGGRIEKGTVCELPDDVAKAYGPEYVVPADTHDTVNVEIDETPLADMTLLQLRDKADALGLSKGGSKADLIERITLHTDASGDDETDEEGDDEGSDEDTDDENA